MVSGLQGLTYNEDILGGLTMDGFQDEMKDSYDDWGDAQEDSDSELDQTDSNEASREWKCNICNSVNSKEDWNCTWCSEPDWEN